MRFYQNQAQALLTQALPTQEQALLPYLFYKGLLYNGLLYNLITLCYIEFRIILQNRYKHDGFNSTIENTFLTKNSAY